MSDIKEIMENVNMDSMVAFLLNESNPLEGSIEVSDKAIQSSYKNFMDKLVGVCPSASKDNDELFDAITEFASVHDEIYFKMGLIVGAGLIRELETGYTKLKELELVR